MLSRLLSIFLKPSTQTISKKDLLKRKPHLSEDISIGTNPDQQKVIIIPRKKRTGLFNSFLNDAPPKQLILDEVGYYVFDLIDGKRTIDYIVKKFSQEHQLHIVEAQTSIINFLSMLKQRGVLVLNK